MKKTLYSAVAAAVLSVSFFSCSEKVHNPEKHETQQTTVSSSSLVTTDTSASFSESETFITDVIQVTDSSGSIVTDSAGNNITQVVTVSELTAASENPKTEKVTDQSTSAETTAEKVTEKTDQESSQPAESSADTESDISDVTQPLPDDSPDREKGIIVMNWLCSNGSSTLNSDGEILILTMKIKENAPSGQYNIGIYTSSGNEEDTVGTPYVSYESISKRKSQLGSGILSVGCSAPADQTYDGRDMFTKILNTSGNPGDTVSIPVMLSNNRLGDIGTFSFNFSYDASVLEYISVSGGSALESLPSPGQISVNAKTEPY